MSVGTRESQKSGIDAEAKQSVRSADSRMITRHWLWRPWEENDYDCGQGQLVRPSGLMQAITLVRAHMITHTRTHLYTVHTQIRAQSTHTHFNNHAKPSGEKTPINQSAMRQNEWAIAFSGTALRVILGQRRGRAEQLLLCSLILTRGTALQQNWAQQIHCKTSSWSKSFQFLGVWEN